MVRITCKEDRASVERSGLSVNPSPPSHQRTVTRNRISYQLFYSNGELIMNRRCQFTCLLTLIVSIALATPVGAATVTWLNPSRTQVQNVGDTIVDPSGTLIEAVNYDTSATDRTVNGVTFDSVTGGTHHNASVYTNGNVGGTFQRVMDSFVFGPGSPATSNPNDTGTRTHTLSGLTPGETYQVQYFVSDDRTANLRARRQSFTGGANTSNVSTQGASYMLRGVFTADAATQDILVNGIEPSSQAITGSPIINAYQVRGVYAPNGSADIDWQTPVAISTVGNSIVDNTSGTLVEAFNMDNNSTNRTVNGVTFTGASSRDDFGSSYSHSTIYQDGNVGAPFASLLDSFGYVPGTSGSGTTDGTLSLTGLTAGNEYLLQLLFSDDRNATLESRSMLLGAGESLSDLFYMGDSVSLIGTFTATGETQDIDLYGFAGLNQNNGSPIINGFQLRVTYIIPEPMTMLAIGLGISGLGGYIRKRRRA